MIIGLLSILFTILIIIGLTLILVTSAIVIFAIVWIYLTKKDIFNALAWEVYKRSLIKSYNENGSTELSSQQKAHLEKYIEDEVMVLTTVNNRGRIVSLVRMS